MEQDASWNGNREIEDSEPMEGDEKGAKQGPQIVAPCPLSLHIWGKQIFSCEGALCISLAGLHRTTVSGITVRTLYGLSYEEVAKAEATAK